MKHVVYTLRDSSAAVLYVGCTKNLKKRLADHKSTKDWWSTVDRVETAEYPDRASGRWAEFDAIRRTQPRYNRVCLKPLPTDVVEALSTKLGCQLVTTDEATLPLHHSDAWIERELAARGVQPVVRVGPNNLWDAADIAEMKSKQAKESKK